MRRVMHASDLALSLMISVFILSVVLPFMWLEMANIGIFDELVVEQRERIIFERVLRSMDSLVAVYRS